ncbi:uncharacterized protein LOC120212376 [Hibiscus syriacus]|uniref:uncharacterized protein LOC120212376 n=1 Tax=Hibiscus syriacus TaxID=106335 RepID=UPI001923B77B|nr:uncharacterized protein LOC120212376 [Hibiscus syriacus]
MVLLSASKHDCLLREYNQREGVDFVDIFSSVAKLVTLRLVLALVAIFHCLIFQTDVHNAFLQGDLPEEVYMKMPDGFCSPGKNMSKNDYSLFSKRHGDKLVIMLIYVDDLLITGNCLDLNLHLATVEYDERTKQQLEDDMYLSQFMQQPKRSHLEAAMRVVRYFKKDHGRGISLSSTSKMQLIAHCDSDWASCLVSQRSVTGFCVRLGDSLVS